VSEHQTKDGQVEGGGFTASPDDESRFVDAVIQGRYGAPEVPLHGGVATGVGALFCALGTFAALRHGQRPFSEVLIFYAVVLAGIAYARFRMHRERGVEGCPPHPHACWETEEGLMPSLADGERLIRRLSVSLPARDGFRRISGFVQLGWGVMLAGLPLATVVAPGEPLEGGYLAWAAIFTLAGALVVGRGVRDLLFLGNARALVLTNERLVLLAGLGAARSIALEHLGHRPVVVRRVDGTATLGLDLPRLTSAGMLPWKGLWGTDGIEPDEADAWAQDLIEQRGMCVSESP
jgi:hypothetical protein